MTLIYHFHFFHGLFLIFRFGSYAKVSVKKNEGRDAISRPKNEDDNLDEQYIQTFWLIQSALFAFFKPTLGLQRVINQNSFPLFLVPSKAVVGYVLKVSLAFWIAAVKRPEREFLRLLSVLEYRQRLMIFHQHVFFNLVKHC